MSLIIKGPVAPTWGGIIRGLRRHTELCEIRGNFGDLYLTHRGSKIIERLVPGFGWSYFQDALGPSGRMGAGERC